MMKAISVSFVGVMVLELMTAGLLQAAVFYVDPNQGSMSNDGSADRPWKTIQEVFEANLIQTRGTDGLLRNANAPVKPGDTLLLRTGFHGEIYCRGAYNDDYITIAAQKGHSPQVGHVFFAAARKWVIRGLTVSPSLAPQYVRERLIYVVAWGGPSADFVIEDNTLFSVPDASSWSAQEWDSRACYGISVNGERMVIRNNTLMNVDFGIVVTGKDMTVERNRLEHIAGDGIVCGADNTALLYNTMKYFYTVNANHDDAIQFHRGADKTTPIVNAVVRGNCIIARDHMVSHPLIASPQGICNFDIPAINWRIENNVVLVQHHHGITIYGCQGGVIVNNLAYNPYGGQFLAGIALGTTPAQTASKDTIVRNNLVDSEVGASTTNNVVDHNIIVQHPALYFRDPQTYDMHHQEGSPAIDAGTELLAPNTDIDGLPRPQGAGFDVGPYEDEAVIAPAPLPLP